MCGAVEDQPLRIGRENLRFHVNVGRGNQLIRELDDLQVSLSDRGTSSGLIFNLRLLRGMARSEPGVSAANNP